MNNKIRSRHNTCSNFQPIAVESLGPINASGRVFLSKPVASLLISRATTEKSAFHFSDSPF